MKNCFREFTLFYIWKVLILFGPITVANGNDNFLIVKTEKGEVRGHKAYTLLDGRAYYSFKGIPYGKAPLENLRFKPPVEADLWNYTLNAFEYRDNCVNTVFYTGEVVGNEDCLFMNVYVPVRTSHKKIPVMLFIHGGGFYSGTSNSYGPDFLIDNDVILVTFNYRMGPFGFLSLGTREYSGNMGLKDQLLAIKWVHRNIGKFGGNKRLITLFGQSAGSSATQLHMMSHQSRRLFNKAVLQSGTSDNLWAFNPESNQVNLVYKVAEKVANVSHNYDDLVNFLLNVDSYVLSRETFFSQFLPGAARQELNVVWAPVIEDRNADDPFLTQDPIELTEKTRIDIDIMIGYTSLEACIVGRPIIEDPQLLQPFNDDFQIELPLIYPTYRYDSMIYKKLMRKIRYDYFKNSRIDKDTLNIYFNLLSDDFITYPIHKAAIKTKLKSTRKVFYYINNLDTSLNAIKEYSGADKIGLPGTCHGDDLFYIFKIEAPVFGEIIDGKYDNLPQNGVEIKSIRRISKLWTNFAKYGNPTPYGEPVHFKSIHLPMINYVEINNEGIFPGIFPRAKNYTIWDEVYDILTRNSIEKDELNQEIINDYFFKTYI